MTSSLRKDVVSVAKLQILITGIGFLTQVFLARYLGPEQKGVLDFFLLIPMVVASLIDLGLLPANTYFAGKRRVPTEILHSQSILWSLLVTLTLLLLAVAFHAFLQELFPTPRGTFLTLSIVLAGPTLYFSLWSGLMYGADRVQSVYRFNTLSSAATLLLYVAAAYFFRLSLEAFLYLSGGILLLKALVALLVPRTEIPLRISLNASAFRASLGYGIALYLGLMVNTLHFRLDQFFVNSIKGPADLANYALAVRIAEMVWLLDYAIINASVFRITASTVEEATRITQRMARLVGLIVIVASILLSIAAPFAVPLIFGTGFSPAVLPLILLLPGMLAWSLSRVLAQFTAYQSGKPWINTRASAIALVVNTILIIILIPRYGIAGAAVASSVSYFCNYLLVAQAFKRLSGTKLLSILIPTREDILTMKNAVSESFPVYARKS